jgi:hypothetical protein
MKPAVIRTLTATFEGHAQQTEDGVEYWLARDLQHLLGYAEWRNFQAVLSKARTACEVSGHAVSDHFVDVNKMVDLGSGSRRQVEDLMLTRYACYLVAQNEFAAEAAARLMSLKGPRLPCGRRTSLQRHPPSRRFSGGRLRHRDPHPQRPRAPDAQRGRDLVRAHLQQ